MNFLSTTILQPLSLLPPPLIGKPKTNQKFTPYQSYPTKPLQQQQQQSTQNRNMTEEEYKAFEEDMLKNMDTDLWDMPQDSLEDDNMESYFLTKDFQENQAKIERERMQHRKEEEEKVKEEMEQVITTRTPKQSKPATVQDVQILSQLLFGGKSEEAQTSKKEELEKQAKENTKPHTSTTSLPLPAAGESAIGEPIAKSINTSAPPIVQVSQLEGRCWQYIDPSGVLQGPFTNKEMSQWHAQNFVKGHLIVKLVSEERFATVSQRFNGRGTPFSTAPIDVAALGADALTFEQALAKVKQSSRKGKSSRDGSSSSGSSSGSSRSSKSSSSSSSSSAAAAKAQAVSTDASALAAGKVKAQTQIHTGKGEGTGAGAGVDVLRLPLQASHHHPLPVLPGMPAAPGPMGYTSPSPSASPSSRDSQVSSPASISASASPSPSPSPAALAQAKISAFPPLPAIHPPLPIQQQPHLLPQPIPSSSAVGDASRHAMFWGAPSAHLLPTPNQALPPRPAGQPALTQQKQMASAGTALGAPAALAYPPAQPQPQPQPQPQSQAQAQAMAKEGEVFNWIRQSVYELTQKDNIQLVSDLMVAADALTLNKLIEKHLGPKSAQRDLFAQQLLRLKTHGI